MPIYKQLVPVYKQFSQGICVATAGLSSMITLGYMMNDNYKVELKHVRSAYEEQIKTLQNENDTLKLHKGLSKMNLQ
jgi:hypothetical protein